jgi:4-aminobutyrate aminotransferase-like enzyme/Ser/Thr protein kinase RdoA (MazF antagonist)
LEGHQSKGDFPTPEGFGNICGRKRNEGGAWAIFQHPKGLETSEGENETKAAHGRFSNIYQHHSTRVTSFMFETNFTTSPQFTSEQAQAVLRDHWHLEGQLKPLASYQDQNFLLTTHDHQKYVLKIANEATPLEWLDLQNQLMHHLASSSIPQLIPSKDEQYMVNHDSHEWRLISFIHGTMLGEIPFRSEAFLTHLGQYAAQLTQRLKSFSHPASERPVQWDLQQAASLIETWKHFNQVKKVSKLIEEVLASWKQLAPKAATLRRSVIHADMTRYNLLINEAGNNIEGLIDFGDVCLSWTIGEVAVLLLESVMIGSPTPFADAECFLKAFHAIEPLEKHELEMLFPLMKLRSASLLCASARQLSLDPKNEYVQEQAHDDAVMFEHVMAFSPDLMRQIFFQACGYSAPNAPNLRKQRPILDLPKDCPILDFSPKSSLFNQAGKHYAREFPRTLKDHLGIVPFGSVHFANVLEPSSDEPICVALGTFAFAPSGKLIYSPFAAVVLKNEAYCLTLKTSDGVYILLKNIYTSLEQNDSVKKGECIGIVFTKPPQALPFLWVKASILPETPDFVKPSEAKYWLGMCFDLFGNKEREPDAKDLTERRQKSIQRAQEYYYERPMNLVRGWKQYLISADGRVYLDAINNVAHVGHSHPHIVESGYRQMHLLNTNARFLYESNVSYAERLLSHFPPHLDTVFFVCTGSEANDLALRLARAYTRQQDVMVIDGEYHGNTTAVDEVSTCLLDNPSAAKSVRPFTHPLIQPNTFRGRFRKGESHSMDIASLYAQDAEEKIARLQAKGRNLAAFISESLLGSGGGVEMPHGYLAKVYDAVHQAGGVCIADEVQIGFGRMGTHFWGFEKEGVSPDIVTLGKPLGNGHPISAVVTTAEIAEAYRQQFTYFNTFAGNPVSCQIAHAVLDVIEDEQLQQNAHEVGSYLKNQLETLVDEFEQVGAIYGHGFYLGVDIVQDKEHRQPATAQAMLISERMKQQGIIIYPTGDYYNILKIKPPMCFTKSNADFLVAQLRSILRITAP